jgi:DNA-binding NarL/FixJ family response regulator
LPWSAARQAGDLQAVAYASAFLVHALYYLGEADQAHALVETALRLHKECGDPIGAAMALTQLGSRYLYSGQLTAAAERFSECAQLAHRSGNLWAEKYARWGLGVTAWLLADHDDAITQVHAALRAARDMDDRIGVAMCLDTLGWIAASQKQAAGALTLLAAADAAWAAIPARLLPSLRGHHAAALNTAREALSENAVTAALARGSALSQANAVALALGETAGPGSRTAPPPGENQPRLTRREQDVAALVSRGLSNGQIAATLVISARTVEKHVQHIMDKLGVSTRAQIASWAVAQSSAPRSAGPAHPTAGE